MQLRPFLLTYNLQFLICTSLFSGSAVEWVLIRCEEDAEYKLFCTELEQMPLGKGDPLEQVNSN